MEDYESPMSAEDAVAAEIASLVASGAKTATISGGEPTLLKKRLLSTIVAIRSEGIPFVELQTNAVLIDEGYAEALAESGVTSAFVSLLSHNPAHHDTLCGLEGAFARCLSGIDALLDVGIGVTLNPVTTSLTQDGVVDYVAFVGARLPRVRHISLSAVQPHGRAGQNLGLLPDYGVLSEQIPVALDCAKALGITVLNPYCGLPLCVGWVGDIGQSVEAQEAMSAQWSGPQGVDNRGNKSHGEPCVSCALRTRCGGAWHAYWSERGGIGLSAPELLARPWKEGWEDTACQSKVEVLDVSQAAEVLKTQSTATRWVISGDLNLDGLTCLIQAGATDWVWRVEGDPEEHKSMLVAIRRVLETQRDLPQQGKCRFVWWVVDDVSPKLAHHWAGLAHAMGVSRVLLKGVGLEDAFWQASISRYTGTLVERFDGVR